MKPIDPKLKAAAERMRAKARELLKRMDPEVVEETTGAALGAFEEVPEDYNTPAVESVPLTPEGLSKLSDRPNIITDGFLAAFSDNPFERGRARGRLTKVLMDSEYFQQLIRKKDTDG